MEIAIADQRILLFPDQVTPDDAEQKAWEKKVSSFDTLSKFGSFLSRPKDDDFELLYKEHRYEPFWHVIATAKYVYDRNATYQVPASGAEVKAVTYQASKYDVTNGHIHLAVLEHCIQEEHEEVFIDGITGKPTPELKDYLSHSPKEITGNLEKETPKEAILVPPQSRISAIMRDALAKMIKGIQADTILEEHVKIQCADLYYRPIFSFQYQWKSKGKDAIVEVDGLTGEVGSGKRTFREYMGTVLDRNFLFDVGADAAGMLIPGGSIAVKAAKRYIDTKKTEK